jgi:hypothetical protein
MNAEDRKGGVHMGLPQFPTLPTPPSQETILRLLLETIVLEELALAALVNAEAEKVQSVAGAGVIGPVSPEDLTEINKAVAGVIQAAGDKEEKLLAKLKVVIAAMERPCHPEHDRP